MSDSSKPATERSSGDRQLAEELVERARSEGVDLVGPDGLLSGLTKNVLEAGLEAEMSEHLGYDRHDPSGKNSGNSRNGTRSKNVLTDVGPVEIEVPRDRDGSFEPQLVKKYQRRLAGVDGMVISLVAKGLTTGEVQAHMAEVYGAQRGNERIHGDRAGVGLGLAIVKSITQAHNGTLTIAPRSDGGLRVTAQLPNIPPGESNGTPDNQRQRLHSRRS